MFSTPLTVVTRRIFAGQPLEAAVLPLPSFRAVTVVVRLRVEAWGVVFAGIGVAVIVVVL